VLVRSESEVRERLRGYEADLRHSVSSIYKGRGVSLVNLALFGVEAALTERAVSELEWVLGVGGLESGEVVERD